MTDYQRFIFSTDYSNSAESIEKSRLDKLAEARELLKEEMEAIKHHSYQKGLEEGQAKALDVLNTEMQTHFSALSQELTRIYDFKQELHKMYEQQATNALYHLVQQLYHKSEEIYSREILEQSMAKALKNLPFCTKIVIKVPQDTATYFNDISFKDKLANLGVSDFDLLEDCNLKTGEVLVHWDKSGLLVSKQETVNAVMQAVSCFVEESDKNLVAESVQPEQFMELENIENKEQRQEL
jgi:flagellar biosynthesis/type III secretory pathway protein FliH